MHLPGTKRTCEIWRNVANHCNTRNDTGFYEVMICNSQFATLHCCNRMLRLTNIASMLVIKKHQYCMFTVHAGHLSKIAKYCCHIVAVRVFSMQLLGLYHVLNLQSSNVLKSSLAVGIWPKLQPDPMVTGNVSSFWALFGNLHIEYKRRIVCTKLRCVQVCY